jgi:hypothetical protein
VCTIQAHTGPVAASHIRPSAGAAPQRATRRRAGRGKAASSTGKGRPSTSNGAATAINSSCSNM